LLYSVTFRFIDFIVWITTNVIDTPFGALYLLYILVHTHIHVYTNTYTHKRKGPWQPCKPQLLLPGEAVLRSRNPEFHNDSSTDRRVRHLLLQIYTRHIPTNVTPGWAVTPGSHFCSWVCACLRKQQQQHHTGSWTYDCSIRRLMPWPLGYAGSNLHTKHINKPTIHTFA